MGGDQMEEEYPFSSEEQEEMFAEALLEYLARKNPNPERIGCPDTNIIRDIAFHRKVAPELCKEVLDHIWECSECACDTIEYVEEYKKTKSE